LPDLDFRRILQTVTTAAGARTRFAAVFSSSALPPLRRLCRRRFLLLASLADNPIVRPHCASKQSLCARVVFAAQQQADTAGTRKKELWKD
jgi:hypothetical protein